MNFCWLRFAKQNHWLLKCVRELQWLTNLTCLTNPIRLNDQLQLKSFHYSATLHFVRELQFDHHATTRCWLSHSALGHSCDCCCCWHSCCDDGDGDKCTTDNNADSMDSNGGSTTDRNIHNSNPNMSNNSDNSDTRNTNYYNNDDDNAMNKDSRMSSPKPNPKQDHPIPNGHNNKHAH